MSAESGKELPEFSPEFVSLELVDVWLICDEPESLTFTGCELGLLSIFGHALDFKGDLATDAFVVVEVEDDKAVVGAINDKAVVGAISDKAADTDDAEADDSVTVAVNVDDSGGTGSR